MCHKSEQAKLESREGKWEKYHITRRRAVSAKDIEHFYLIKGKLGKTLSSTGAMNDGERTLKICRPPPHGTALINIFTVKRSVPLITAKEEWFATTRTKNSKTTGPNDLPS
ncbi:unnamed protein product [Strongylus vulgaris]|uniref:Uncharacterized protein n=1 Tax=Strongylus vulgaris TaxID=40348 RepID=A0A3P7IB80_STRVU|nr:unnamed protein product [Strongylus vulgaris]